MIICLSLRPCSRKDDNEDDGEDEDFSEEVKKLKS